MSAITELKPSAMFSWLQTWLAKSRPLIQSLSPADYQVLSLEIASTDSTGLAALLQRCQQRLRYLLNEPALQLSLALPATEHELSLIHSNASTQPAWQARLTQALQQQQRCSLPQDLSCHEIFLSAHSHVAAFPLVLKQNTRCAWLVIKHSLSECDKESLYSLTHPLCQAFSAGLSIYHQRQEEVNRALQAERSAQAAELHDSLAQVLGYLRIRSASLQSEASAMGLECAIKHISDDIAQQTVLAYRQVRELISSSRLNLREETLEQVFANAISEFEQHSAIVFQLENRHPQLMLPPHKVAQLGYIVREALANIVRHSHASYARIRLLQRQHKYYLSIEDNGCGIQPEAARSDSFGLTIMAERAQSIGARFNIYEREGGGTCAEIVFHHERDKH